MPLSYRHLLVVLFLLLVTVGCGRGEPTSEPTATPGPVPTSTLMSGEVVPLSPDDFANLPMVALE